MRKSEAVEYFGTQAQIARLLNIEPAAVSLWAEDNVPQLRQLQLEALSGGVLRADPSILPAASPQQAAGGGDRTGQMG